MPDTVQFPESPRTSDRRLYPRKQLWFPSIQLGDHNGGIILDISESGLAMRAVRSLADGELPAMRFQLSESQTWIETRGRIAWINASRHTAGVEFVGLPAEGRNKIRQWIPLKLHPTGTVEGNPKRELRPTSKPGSPIVVPEREKPERVEEHEGTHSIADDPAAVLPHKAETQNPRTVSVHIGDKNNSAVAQNVRRNTSPAPYLSYRKTTNSLEISDRGRAIGADKSRKRTFLFLTTVMLLLSVLLLVAYYFQRAGKSRLGTEVIAAPKVSEVSPDTSTNPKTESTDPSLLLGQPGFVLQVGAMTHEENAAALAESLQQHDFPAFVSRRGPDRFYRVVVGPYSDLDSALRVKEQLKKAGFDAFRTPWDPSAQ
jgi:septal ring-binding cell division protein DamX